MSNKVIHTGEPFYYYRLRSLYVYVRNRTRYTADGQTVTTATHAITDYRRAVARFDLRWPARGRDVNGAR